MGAPRKKGAEGRRRAGFVTAVAHDGKKPDLTLVSRRRGLDTGPMLSGDINDNPGSPLLFLFFSFFSFSYKRSWFVLQFKTQERNKSDRVCKGKY